MIKSVVKLFVVIWIVFASLCGAWAQTASLVTQGYKAYAERDVKTSEKCFQKFLNESGLYLKNPDRLRAQLGLGYIYILSPDLRDLAKGREYLGDIITKTNTGPEEFSDESTGSEKSAVLMDLRSRAIFLLGRSYHLDRTTKGQEVQAGLEQAQRYYLQYLSEYPQGILKSRVLLYLAQSYLRVGSSEPGRIKDETADIKKAITLLEEFVNSRDGELDEYYAAISYCLGQIYHLRRNDMKSSVRYLSLALEQGLADYTIRSNALYKTAQIYEKKLNKPNKALQYYRQLLEEFPVDSRVNVVKKRIQKIEGSHE